MPVTIELRGFRKWLEYNEHTFRGADMLSCPTVCRVVVGVGVPTPHTISNTQTIDAEGW